MMEYKTKEELMLQPHTLAEHLEENSESDSSLSDGNSYSDSSLSESEEVGGPFSSTKEMRLCWVADYTLQIFILLIIIAKICSFEAPNTF